MVYVLSVTGNPLMPTNRHGKVKHLLRSGKAVVVRRCPFTIRLVYEAGDFTQPITLGVDAGSKTIGMSATTASREVYSAEIALRTDVMDKLATRRELRRGRRFRNTRYRKARFNNRIATKRDGWLAPSVRHKIDSHHRAVAFVHKFLPITKIIVEVASFDIQKIKNPDISGKEYQEGDQLGFWNVREYVLCRDGHTCQHCRGRSKYPVLNVHHIESRKTGGDAPGNLITLCETCHGKYHRGEISVKVRRGASFRDAAFMGIMRWTFYNELKDRYADVSLTFGYITKNTRISHGLPKEHRTDALCITGNPTAIRSDIWHRQKFVRTRNRQIHKATFQKGHIRRRNQAPKYVFGFQQYDVVRMPTGECGFVFGRRTSGYFDIRTIDGKKLSAGIACKKITLLNCRKSLLTEMQRIPPATYANA